jgi:hypothetical protein
MTPLFAVTRDDVADYVGTLIFVYSWRTSSAR